MFISWAGPVCSYFPGVHDIEDIPPDADIRGYV